MRRDEKFAAPFPRLAADLERIDANRRARAMGFQVPKDHGGFVIKDALPEMGFIIDHARPMANLADIMRPAIEAAAWKAVARPVGFDTVMRQENPKVKPTGSDIDAAIQDATLVAPVVDRIMYYKAEHGHNYADGQPATTSLCEVMKALGWERAGNGYFSIAFTKGGMAVKFGLKADDGGSAYAAWCRANQGKAGVPKLYAIIPMGKRYAVVMDRLYPLEGAEAYEQHERLERIVCRAYRRDIAKHECRNALEATAFDIVEFFDGASEFDLHDKNVMLDRDGNVIITDPLSSSSKRP